MSHNNNNMEGNILLQAISAYSAASECQEQVEQILDTILEKDTFLERIIDELRNCVHELASVEGMISVTNNNNNNNISLMCPNPNISLISIKQEIEKLIYIVEERASLYPQLKDERTNILRIHKSNLNIKTNNTAATNSNCGLGARIAQTIEDAKVIENNESLCNLAGLLEIKKLLKSTIILPQTQPQLFINRRISKTILLYGPPGTGKTKLVHALASEANAAFFSVSIGNILSHYVGETEKTLQALFQHIIKSDVYSLLFIDEIDGICRKRSSGEQEYSRRLKTELMSQLTKSERSDTMFIICATNCPWDLDTAILRRFQRRIYVPLPDRAERLEILRLFAAGTALETTENWDEVLDATDGFSGSDLKNAVDNALNVPLVELEETHVWRCCSDGFYEPIHLENLNRKGNIVCCDLHELPARSVRARAVNLGDILTILAGVKGTTSVDDIRRFEEYEGK